MAGKKPSASKMAARKQKAELKDLFHASQELGEVQARAVKGGGQATADVTLNFAKVKVAYEEQTETGSFTKSK
jgi:hypothetical protein